MPSKKDTDNKDGGGFLYQVMMSVMRKVSYGVQDAVEDQGNPL
jgi:hypothetical protein